MESSNERGLPNRARSYDEECCKREEELRPASTLYQLTTGRSRAGAQPLTEGRAFWEEEIHVVVARKGDESPVYELRPETGRGRNRVLHRNLLLPCEHLPLENWCELRWYGTI